jgi:hypothetical protein
VEWLTPVVELVLLCCESRASGVVIGAQVMVMMCRILALEP